MKNILVTGFSGLVAPYIVDRLDRKFSVYTTSRKKGDYTVDITNEFHVKQMLTKLNPNVIIHCAAFTNVDEAEKNLKKVILINEKGTENLVRNIKHDTHFLYISTDQVYPDIPGLHIEGTESPINNYGRSKYKGSLIVKKNHKKYTILHTNIFGKSMNRSRESFIDEIIIKLQKEEELKLFSDAYFSPLNLKTFSIIIEKIISKNIFGTYNLGSRDGMSKEVFIRSIAKQMNLSLNNCKSVISKNIKREAFRALDLRLDVRKIEKKLEETMPSLIEEIKKL